MIIKVSNQDPRPVSVQIADQVRAQITNEQIPAGDKLPGLAPLAKELGVGEPTIQKAYEILKREQLVVATPGRGTFVRDSSQKREHASTPVAVQAELADISERLTELIAQVNELSRRISS